MGKRTVITLETEETVTYRHSRTRLAAFCPICRVNTLMAAPLSWPIFESFGERRLLPLIAKGAVLFIEAGSVYACLPCSEKFVKEDDKS